LAKISETKTLLKYDLEGLNIGVSFSNTPANEWPIDVGILFYYPPVKFKLLLSMLPKADLVSIFIV
jgi:hypothetical protein